MRALIRELAPAKVNLFLHVGARRDDGYHPLQSLAVFTGGETAADVLSLAPADAVSLSLDGPFAVGLEGESDNLVLRAARLLAARTSGVGGAAITLTKNLPVASGIGGGSSDAAAAFRGLSALWHISLDDLTLREMAASLGSDIPACIAAIPAFMEGRGENLTPVAAMPRLSLLLVNPGVALATGDAFRAWDGIDRGPLDYGEPLAAALAGRNDLEPAAIGLVPSIAEVLAALRGAEGILLARMSGSGATCFGLFASAEQRDAASLRIGTERPSWWRLATRLQA